MVHNDSPNWEISLTVFCHCHQTENCCWFLTGFAIILHAIWHSNHIFCTFLIFVQQLLFGSERGIWVLPFILEIQDDNPLLLSWYYSRLLVWTENALKCTLSCSWLDTWYPLCLVFHTYCVITKLITPKLYVITKQFLFSVYISQFMFSLYFFIPLWIFKRVRGYNLWSCQMIRGALMLPFIAQVKQG